MEDRDIQVSHIDLYHKLGKLEGIMESMMTSVSSFQSAVKDIHARIDALEDRQSVLEKRQSQDKGASSALSGLAKDFAIPVLAIIITWLVAANESTLNKKIESLEGQIQHSQTR